MKCLSKWVSAVAAIALLAGSAQAADAVAAGKVKSVNADGKKLVVTDAAGKDLTFKLGDNLVINRGGKESKSDLNAGDTVNVLYDKGVLTSTAHYVLVQEGASKNWTLVCGSVKSYDAGKKQLAFTDEHGKAWTFAMGDAQVRLNQADGKVEDVKIGERAFAIVERRGDTATLKSLRVERK
jgi:hypothetical protein